MFVEKFLVWQKLKEKTKNKNGSILGSELFNKLNVLKNKLQQTYILISSSRVFLEYLYLYVEPPDSLQPYCPTLESWSSYQYR